MRGVIRMKRRLSNTWSRTWNRVNLSVEFGPRPGRDRRPLWAGRKRLPRVKGSNGDRVSWAALRGQFGGDTTDARNFRKDFLTALRQVLVAYPTAKVEQVEGGLRLRRSAPPIHRRLG